MSSKRLSYDEQEWKKQKRTLIKIKFTEEEDQKLLKIISNVGTKNWKEVAAQMKTRNPRQCRERWNNYLNPSLNDNPWTAQEDYLIEVLYDKYGTQWNKIAKHFNNRSDNSLRNRWMRIKRHKNKFSNKLEKISEDKPSPSPTSTEVSEVNLPSQFFEDIPQEFDFFEEPEFTF